MKNKVELLSLQQRGVNDIPPIFKMGKILHYTVNILDTNTSASGWEIVYSPRRRNEEF